jgi:hypothetical protein
MVWADVISGACGPKYGAHSDYFALTSPSTERRNGGDACFQQHPTSLRPPMIYADGSNGFKHRNTRIGSTGGRLSFKKPSTLASLATSTGGCAMTDRLGSPFSAATTALSQALPGNYRN